MGQGRDLTLLEKSDASSWLRSSITWKHHFRVVSCSCRCRLVITILIRSSFASPPSSRWNILGSNSSCNLSQSHTLSNTIRDFFLLTPFIKNSDNPSNKPVWSLICLEISDITSERTHPRDIETQAWYLKYFSIVAWLYIFLARVVFPEPPIPKIARTSTQSFSLIKIFTNFSISKSIPTAYSLSDWIWHLGDSDPRVRTPLIEPSIESAINLFFSFMEDRSFRSSFVVWWARYSLLNPRIKFRDDSVSET